MSTMIRVTDRRVVRRAIELPCEVVRERDFVRVADRAIDVSPDGMLIAGADGAELGDELLLTFRLPGGRIWYDAGARVTRIVRGLRQHDRMRAVGVRLDFFEPSARVLLAEGLRGLPPPVPRRRVRIDYASTVRAV